MNSELKSLDFLASTRASVIGTPMPSPTNISICALYSAVASTMTSGSKSRNRIRWPPMLTKVRSVNKPAPCIKGAEITTLKPPSGETLSATSCGLCRLSPYGLPPDRHA